MPLPPPEILEESTRLHFHYQGIKRAKGVDAPETRAAFKEMMAFRIEHGLGCESGPVEPAAPAAAAATPPAA